MNIVVCLSRDLTFFSNLTYLADGGGLTHASIGLSEDAELYYSFNFKGMKKEYRTSLKKRPRQMNRYIIEVSDEAGNKLKSMIDEMLEQKEKYQYSKLGVSLSLLHLPNNTKEDDSYYCSQFVAAVLKESGCVDIKTKPSDCLPNVLLKELEESGQIVRVEEESRLVNPADKAFEKGKEGLARGYEKLSDVIEESKEIASQFSGDDDDSKEEPDKAQNSGLDNVYDNMVVKLNVAQKATSQAPEKLAKLTGGLLKQGSEKLMELGETAKGLLRGDYPKQTKKSKKAKTAKKINKKK